MNIKPIKCEADYDAALLRVDELMDVDLDTPQGDRLEYTLLTQ